MTEKQYSTLSVWLRSIIYFCVAMVTIPVFSVLVLCTFFLPLKTRFVVIRFTLGTQLRILKWICNIKYHVTGLENIPKDRVGIIMSKHQSTWETFFLPTIFKQPAVIAKREILWVPFFGWALRIANPITINRSNKRKAMLQIIEQGKACLAAGRWIMVFPEGTRIPYGEVGHYRLGGARLAEATGAPIIPVAHNAGKFWPRRKFLKYPGTIEVRIGPPIETKGKPADQIMALTKGWIESSVNDICGLINESASE